MVHPAKNRVFGKRKKHHTFIIASDEKVRHLTIRPWVLALIGCFITTIVIGYLTATTYLVLRDDLIGAKMAHQTRIQNTYEDRIAELRSQVDRAISRRLIDQQRMEDKVTVLLENQNILSFRQNRLAPIVQKATNAGISPLQVPVPKSRPSEKSANLETSPSSFAANAVFATNTNLRNTQNVDQLFGEVRQSLVAMETSQLQQISALHEDTYTTANAIAGILSETGLSLPKNTQSGIGGPYIQPPKSAGFNEKLSTLTYAIEQLDQLKAHVKNMPVSHPAAYASVSSRYGTRRDPFFKKKAFHSGLDFKTPYGAQIKSAGAGKVVFAGRKGGYGKLIEIDHGNGYTSRYAHLSKILVKTNQYVDAQKLIAKAGSTGRSTGPHLHYEVRKNGKALNPIRFVNAGLRLTKILQ